MCGNVGVFSFNKKGIDKQEYDIFFDLLYADALRGMHGTGVLAVDKRANYYMTKIGGPPHQLVSTPQYHDLEKFVSNKCARFLIGHNRYATRGQKTTEHAHPFRRGNIILMHNGTLDTYSHFPSPEKKIEVDSEHLAYSIDKIGIDDTIKDTVGAWAIIYWDMKDKTLNILRNAERPLYIAKEKDFFAYASEAEMLKWVLDRNYNWSMVEKVDMVPVDTLITFKLDGGGEFTTRPLAGKERPKSILSKTKEEMRQIYCEIFSAEETAQDLVGQPRQQVAEIVDITPNVTQKPHVTYNHSTGDWGRGKVGQVKALPAPKKHDPAKSHRQVQHLHDLSKDKQLVVELSNYDSLSGSKEPKTFLCLLVSEEYPDIEFRAYVQGEDKVDSIIEAKFGVIGRVASILQSNRSTAEMPHHVYLHDLQVIPEGAAA